MGKSAKFLVVELPWPDIDKLGGNKRGSWRNSSGPFAQHKNIARSATLTAMEGIGRGTPLQLEEELELEYSFYSPTRRLADLDNLIASCKAFQDGICQALDINDRQICKLGGWRAGWIDGGLVVAWLGNIER